MKNWKENIIGVDEILRRLVSLCFFISVFLNNIPAQSYLNFHDFSKLNSFPNTNLYDIAQDDYGYIWLATRNGLIKFNGWKYETNQTPLRDGRTLPTEAFYNVFCDSKGVVWGGTYSGGLYKVDVKKNRAYHFPADKKNKNALPDSRIKAMFEDPDGNIWVGCHKEGFCQYQPATNDFKCYKPSVILKQQEKERFLDDVICFHWQDNALWVGTLDGLLRFDPMTEKIKSINYIEKLENPGDVNGPSNGVREIVKLSEDELLFYAYAVDDVAFIYDIYNKKTRAIKLSFNEREKHRTTSIYKNGNDIYFVKGDRLVVLNADTRKMVNIDNDSKFTNVSFDIANLFKDKQGGLWGVSKRKLYHLKAPTVGSEAIGLTGGSESILELNKNELLYLENRKEKVGIFNWRTNEIISNEFDLSGHSKNNKWLYQLFKGPDDKVYANSDGNIYVLNNAKNGFDKYWRYPSLFNNESSESIMSGYLDSRGLYWMGTKNYGVLQVDISNKNTVNFKNDKDNEKQIAYNGYVTGFYEDNKSRLWYGSDAGFGYYNYLTERFINFPIDKYTTDNADYQMKGVAGFKQDAKGRIWLVENHFGLGYILEDELLEDELVIKIVSPKDGIWDDHIQHTAIDKNGDLWVSHWKGLSRIQAADLKIENFGFESGFTFNANLVPFSDGSLGAVKSGHLQKINTDEIKEIEVVPKIILKNVKVFDEPMSMGQNWNEINKLELNYKQNFFSIYFDVINFQNADMQEIQYQMTGLHDEWVNASGRDYVSFSNLEGGDYKFKIRARLKAREWGGVKMLHIHVTPPYWKTGWFYLLVAAIVSGIVFAIYKYRIKTIKEQEELKSAFKVQLAEVEMTALRAQMNPHFLFNCLNSIKLFIVEKDTKAASDYLTKFSKLIRLILQNSKNKLIRLSDELEALELYVQMEKMRFDHQFEYYINIEHGLDLSQFEIPPLLLQPYVENAIWHGLVHTDRPNWLLISIEKNNGRLICAIEDNGIGREAAQQRKTHRNARKQSLGMAITENRIELTKELYQIETDVEIVDLKNEDGSAAGTRVVVRVLGSVK